MLEMRNGLEQDLDRDRSAGADCWGRDETAFMLAAPGGNSLLLQLKIANIKIQPTEMISVIICAKLFLTNANCLALAWEIFSRLFLIVAGVDTGTDMSTLSSGAANNDLSTHNNNLRHQILQTMGTLLQPAAVNHRVPAYLSYLLSPWFYIEQVKFVFCECDSQQELLPSKYIVFKFKIAMSVCLIRLMMILTMIVMLRWLLQLLLFSQTPLIIRLC